MATRSRIAVRVSQGMAIFGKDVKAGQVIHIYSHWDGYPDAKIPTLTKSYNTEEKAIALIIQGNISSLSDSCEKPEGHTFENPTEGYTTYYGRDRGEFDQEFEIGNWEEARNQEEFGYLFEDGKWTWTDSYYKTIKEKEDELEKYGETMSFKDSFVEQV